MYIVFYALSLKLYLHHLPGGHVKLLDTCDLELLNSKVTNAVGQKEKTQGEKGLK